MIAFYPVKPIYSEKVMNGIKTFELRKRLPSSEINHVIIYSTMPVGMVVGYAKVKALHKQGVEMLWKYVSAHAGISKDDYLAYFHGADEACAIELEEVRRFSKPFPVSDIDNDFTVPQSFCYIAKDTFTKLKRRKAVPV